MAIILDVFSWFLILTGCAFTIIGAVGQVRFPNFWARMHAASVSDSAGVILLIAGMCLQSGLTLVTVKLVVIGVFLFVTGATSTHATASAALVSGLRPPMLKKTVGGDDDAAGTAEGPVA